ncbi:hypothetical protein ACFR9U_14255 [Halorientalis brevis]|uniref:Restriction endonuclease n=1 Tax=Halorientalis brevis TaxID=1126241 RepID=A0ABD6CFG5_9EURY|nr:hypothetical protein [Halorientalis brevis]
MTDARSLTGELAATFTDVIHEVDTEIGENRTYGEGIGPHDEDDQVDALVNAVRARELFDGTVATAKSDSGAVSYPGGQSADLRIERGSTTEYCEAKLLRFQKANGNPSTRGFSKVFNPFQDHSPRSFIHDVSKLAESDIRARKIYLGLYYRPVDGAGSEIQSSEIAEKFAADVTHWTDHPISVDTVAQFSDLQHEVHQRGAIIVWTLDDQPRRFF